MTAPATRRDQLYAFFLAREGCWIDSDRLERAWGRCGWRSRISEVRRTLARPQGYDIVNRQQRKKVGKRTYTVSFYALQKAASPSFLHSTPVLRAS